MEASCFICIGSNYEREKNLSFARRVLSEHFAGITFADIDDTAPVHMHNSAHFLNQVAHINTSLTKEAVNKIFKDIERAAGRCPEDRRKEIVRLDIDLLTYSDEVLKPDDVSREYIVKGIESIS